MMVGIVTLSFTLLSTAFMLLSYRYIISETRDRLERNAGYIASATGNYLQNFNSWNIFDSRADTWILYQTTRSPSRSWTRSWSGETTPDSPT